jgi:hypothetical protein
MPDTEIISDALIKPLSEVLLSVGKSIVETQHALDRNSADTQILIENDEVLSQYDIKATWYHMPEIDLELKMSLSVHEKTNIDTQISIPVLMSSPLNASYTKNFDYDVAGSSLIKVKIVSTPPPSTLEA